MMRACVIGWPVSHSRSPLIHGYWLQRYGIDGSYVRHPVEPERCRRLSCAPCATQGFAGCNVTLPHKEAAFAAVDPKRGLRRALLAPPTRSGSRAASSSPTTPTAPGFMNNLRAAAPALQLSGCDRLGARRRRRGARHRVRPA